MKTLNVYMAMSYRMEIVEDKDEGGFVVSYPDLPGCITCGETVESAVANALDAKKAWLEAALEDGVEIHEPDSLEDYSGQFKLRIPRSLHRSPGTRRFAAVLRQHRAARSLRRCRSAPASGCSPRPPAGVHRS